MNSFSTFTPTSAQVKKVWDKDDYLSPETAFVLHIDTNDRTNISIHSNRAGLEIIYKALDDYFANIHHYETLEKEYETYSEAMFEKMEEGLLP